jgi:hypothetical protein
MVKIGKHKAISTGTSSDNPHRKASSVKFKYVYMDIRADTIA